MTVRSFGTVSELSKIVDIKRLGIALHLRANVDEIIGDPTFLVRDLYSLFFYIKDLKPVEWEVTQLFCIGDKIVYRLDNELTPLYEPIALEHLSSMEVIAASFSTPEILITNILWALTYKQWPLEYVEFQKDTPPNEIPDNDWEPETDGELEALRDEFLKQLRLG